MDILDYIDKIVTGKPTLVEQKNTVSLRSTSTTSSGQLQSEHKPYS